MRLQNSKSFRWPCVFLPNESLICSFSAQPQYPEPFRRSSPVSDDPVTRLCRENRFKEATDVLCQKNRVKDAIQLLNQMDKPSAPIYSAVIQCCLKTRSLKAGRKVHHHIKRSGFLPGQFILNRLLDMYVKCDGIDEAHKLFNEMGEKDLCSWNVLISGYSRLGLLEKARKLFDEMPDRDNFTWNAMISGYVRCDMPREALDLCRMMNKSLNSQGNKFTVSSAIAAVALVPCLRIGKEIHGHIMRTGLDSDQVVWSSLSDMYGKCGSIDEARHIFDRMVDRDVVSWTTMIGRYFEDGRRAEALNLFNKLLESGTRPNEFTFAAVLNACTDVTAEELGKQVHGYMIRIGSNPISFAGSALVHMYSKCGNMVNAERVFKGMKQPDLVSWTSLIAGYAQNGQPNESLQYFELLLKSEVRPDHITFVGVLSACAHAGLVEQGLAYFYSIKEKHGLTHTAEHYACIIDLLARCGKFEKAEGIIGEMPIKPDKFLWASLLGGCRIHNHIELAEKSAEALFEIEPGNPATYVTMANIYATAGRWADVARIRKLMDDKGVVKKPGKSWIEIKRKTHVFLVGDKSHPKWKQIHEFLCEISIKMKEEGFFAHTNTVLHDVEEEQKEESLSYHSEKLAIAYGVISTPPGTTIKVYKNLRTCVDCHEAIKFISKIVDRKIIVRDSARFHCFEKGSCSCGDYW
ncbi:Pentatricopeptide repeat-containing protein At4g37170 [Linum perenne]